MAFATETDLRYPIGKFERPESLTADQRRAAIRQIEEASAKLRAAVAGLSDQQLDTPYRPGGWTVRQTVHHVADSHMNAFTRVKLALTEDTPTIKPYLEARWAELADSKVPIGPSLDILDGLHQRWTALFRSFAPADWTLGYVHPEHGRKMSLDQTLALYSWHGRHHTAHITSLRDRNSWR
ncbi:MAG: YfiT family bacillithiol transferase [Candidatus Acidiferrales bacterium]